MPLVSIVTPVLNGDRYVELCLRSVLEQTYTNIEHIFVDGGSTDSTLHTLDRYSREYPARIRYVAGQDDGIGTALNKGMKLAQGEVLGWIDSDDVYEPDAVAAAVSFLMQHRDAYFVFGECNIIDAWGKQIGKFPIKDFDLHEVVTKRDYVVFCASFFRREVFEATGGFNRIANDTDFWIRVALRYKLHRIPTVLANWRLHKDSVSAFKNTRGRAMIRTQLREDAGLCLKYGGHRYSRRYLRYVFFQIQDKLGIHYYLNFVILAKLRQNRLAVRLLRAVGAD